jgi:hypothetical protein
MSSTTVEVGRWYPSPAPALDRESDAAYTDRLTGADQANRRPYDHPRNRECSIAFHNTCSERGYHPGTGNCQCPCHSDAPVPAELLTPVITAAADALARLYYLPDSTAQRCMLLAVDAGGVPDLVSATIGSYYRSKVSDWFVTDVARILRDVGPGPRRGQVQ